MFSEKYTPINCRSSLEGIFQFTYQYRLVTIFIFQICLQLVRFVSTGLCTNPEQQIHSCQNVGSQFGISNQKFNMTYKKCDGMEWTKNASMSAGYFLAPPPPLPPGSVPDNVNLP